MPLVRQPCRRSCFIRGLTILVFITLATHGLSLFDGKILDDFWHQKGLRENGWSLSELMRTSAIAPADFLHTWWQEKPVVWQYFRPFFILCMKFVFIVVGNKNPMSLHAVSIGLHLISTLLVWRLCRLLTNHESWSLIGGLLFAIYPHSVITVAWPSSQNVVLQTTLLLATIHAYLRASGLSRGEGESGASVAALGPSIPPLSGTWIGLAFFSWTLAILTRENAILIPAILASFDLAYGGRKHLWARRGVYLVFVVVGVALVACREYLHVSPLPDLYCRRPDGDWGQYLPWLAAKFLHYLCASIWIAPMSVGPTGRYNPWTEVPGDCLLMAGIVAGLCVIYYRSARAAQGWWIWPLWIVISILPVTAVVATPHSGYMCGVGWACAAALAPAAALHTQSRRTARWATGTTLLLALGAAFMTPVNRLQWTAVASAERLLHSWVMVSPPSRQVRDVFFINMPFVNIYAKPNMVDRLGTWSERNRVHVLTYAPQVMGMDQPTVVEQIDDNSFTVEVRGQAFFSRLVGRFALEGFRGKGLLRIGDRVDAGDFVVDVLEADERGVWKLKFKFPRPLNSPAYCFYLSTKECGAAHLRFCGMQEAAREVIDSPIVDSVAMETAVAELEAGRLTSAGSLFATAKAADSPLAARASGVLRQVVGHMARTLGARAQFLLETPQPTKDAWAELESWWRRNVDRQYLRELWLRRHDFDDLVYLRYEIDFDRHIAGHIIRTDLYLSGPPYDDPRPSP